MDRSVAGGDLWLRQRLGWIDDARRKHSWVYPQCAAAGGTVWYLIRRARVCAAVAEPTDMATAEAAAEAIRRVFAFEASWDRLLPKNLVDHVLLVGAWFRKHPKELERAKTAADALARCGQFARSRDAA